MTCSTVIQGRTSGWSNVVVLSASCFLIDPHYQEAPMTHYHSLSSFYVELENPHLKSWWGRTSEQQLQAERHPVHFSDKTNRSHMCTEHTDPRPQGLLTLRVQRWRSGASLRRCEWECLVFRVSAVVNLCLSESARLRAIDSTVEKCVITTAGIGLVFLLGARTVIMDSLDVDKYCLFCTVQVL